MPRAPVPPRRPPTGLASPCINVCRMDDATGWCSGCLRTLDEIAAWSALDDSGRRVVLARLPERRRLATSAAARKPAD